LRAGEASAPQADGTRGVPGAGVFVIGGGTPKPAMRRRPNRLIARGVAALVLLAAVAGMAHWFAQRWTHVFIVDSRVAAKMVTLSSEVSGRVTAVRVVTGDRVRQGDLLVAIDPRQTELELAALDAQLRRLETQQDQLRAQQTMATAQVASRLDAAAAELSAATARHRSAEAELVNIRGEHERVSRLHERQILSAQRFDEIRARLVTAEQQERTAAAGIRTARANHATAEAERTQIAMLGLQIASLDAEKAALHSTRSQKLIDLEHREIRAAFDGVIDSTFVDAGEYVSPGSRLAIYHDPANVWIDANVKETDFRRLKLGAKASVVVDAFPDRTFPGEVIRLGHAATSQFALLPSPNPSGNFTKVTQRLPVRISIQQEDILLRPGMMVEVAVDVAD